MLNARQTIFSTKKDVTITVQRDNMGVLPLHVVVRYYFFFFIEFRKERIWKYALRKCGMHMQ